MKATELTKGALLAALTALFALSFIYLPLFSVFGLFLGVCTVTVLLTHVESVKVSVTALAVALLLIALFSDLQTMLLSGLLMIVLPGAVMGTCFRKRQPFSVILVSGSVAYLVAVLGTFLWFQFAYGMDMIEEFRQGLQQGMDAFLKVAGETPELSQSAEEVAKTIPRLIELMTYMLPSSLMMASATLALGGVLLSRSVLQKLQYGFFYLPSFSQLKAPRMIARGSVVLLFAELLVMNRGMIYFLVYNVNMILTAVLFVSGLSFLKHLLNRAKLPKGISGLVFCLSLPLGMMLFQLVSLIGLVDSLWDFRRLGKE